MLALRDRSEVEGLTHHEVIEILTMQDMEEQDRRWWLLAQKSTDPVKTYSEMREAIEDAVTPAIDLDTHPLRDWYRNN